MFSPSTCNWLILDNLLHRESPRMTACLIGIMWKSTTANEWPKRGLQAVRCLDKNPHTSHPEGNGNSDCDYSVDIRYWHRLFDLVKGLFGDIHEATRQQVFKPASQSLQEHMACLTVVGEGCRVMTPKRASDSVWRGRSARNKSVLVLIWHLLSLNSK